jgi:hypothetical protein
LSVGRVVENPGPDEPASAWLMKGESSPRTGISPGWLGRAWSVLSAGRHQVRSLGGWLLAALGLTPSSPECGRLGRAFFTIGKTGTSGSGKGWTAQPDAPAATARRLQPALSPLPIHTWITLPVTTGSTPSDHDASVNEAGCEEAPAQGTTWGKHGAPGPLGMSVGGESRGYEPARA